LEFDGASIMMMLIDWLAVKRGSIRRFSTNSDFRVLRHQESLVSVGEESFYTLKIQQIVP